MRVRLFIDIEWPEDRIMELGALATDQTPVSIVERARKPIAGRIMGAQPVEGFTNPGSATRAPTSEG